MRVRRERDFTRGILPLALRANLRFVQKGPPGLFVNPLKMLLRSITAPQTLLPLLHFPDCSPQNAKRPLKNSGCRLFRAQDARQKETRRRGGESEFFQRPFGVLRGAIGKMAEREGFEPPRPSRVCRFSKPVQSTTLPSLREPSP